MQKVFMHISEAMRTRILLLFLLFTVTTITAQTQDAKFYTEDFVGTWQYVNNDTVFTVKFVKGTQINGFTEKVNKRSRLNGGYALQVKGVVVDDYLENINPVLDAHINPPLQYIYMTGSVSFLPTSYFVFKFYDQRKKHFNGKGIWGGIITLLSKNKLKWTLNEERGISTWLEGCEDCPEIKPIGFSVPTNVILTKVE